MSKDNPAELQSSLEALSGDGEMPASSDEAALPSSPKAHRHKPTPPTADGEPASPRAEAGSVAEGCKPTTTGVTVSGADCPTYSPPAVTDVDAAPLSVRHQTSENLGPNEGSQNESDEAAVTEENLPVASLEHDQSNRPTEPLDDPESVCGRKDV